jgi:hypothetical protein
MEKPTYEELEKKVKQLETDKELIHTTLAKYLKDLNHNVLGLLIGTEAPFKLEKYFGHPTETLDLKNPNFEYYKNRYVKIILQTDS